MIVTVTMNPAIDKSTSIDSLIPEKKLRCENLSVEPGGGGINVSKAIKKLGGTSTAIFPSGGLNGKLLEEFLTKEGIDHHVIPLQEDTRESFTVNENRTNAQYRFVMEGPEMSEAEYDQVFRVMDKLPVKPNYIVSSGSLPPGVPEDFTARLARYSKKIGARCIIDTSGKPLQYAVDEGVYLIKPNITELCSLAGTDHLELNEVDDAAMQIIKTGKCEVLIISLGPSGALLVTRNGYEHIPAPTVKKNTTVGAGDSMVAGMVWKLDQGKSLKEMVRFGIACGTAATMNKGTQLFNIADVNRLYDWMIHFSDKYKLNLDNDLQDAIQ